MSDVTIDYSDILDGVKNLLGVDQLTTDDRTAVDRFFRKHHRLMWKEYEWPWSYTFGEERTVTSNVVLFAEATKSTIADFFDIYRDDPTANKYPVRIPWVPVATGARLISSSIPSTAYVDYRKRRDRFIGNEFDSTATYASGDVIWFTDSNSKVNWWEANASTSAGEDPDDTPAKWDQLTINEDMEEYLIQAIYGELLKMDGNNEMGAMELAQARDILLDTIMDYERQQNQRYSTRFITHGVRQLRQTY